MFFASLYLRNPALKAGTAFTLPNIIIGAIARNFSSKIPSSTVLLQTQISKDTAANLSDAIGSFYAKLPSNTIIRETNKKELEQWTKYLSPILRKDSELTEILDLAKKQKPPIIFLQGLDIPTLALEEIPTHARDLSKPEFIRKAKHAQILTALIFDQVGIKLDLPFTTVYASKEEVESSGSYKSSKQPLEWHTDGWKNIPPEYVGLLCIKGHENALTQVITTDQIIQYFKEKNQEHLLKELESEYHMGGPYEEQASILKDKKIRFAEYGEIERRGGDRTATEALIKCLNDLNPAIGAVMKQGDFLLVNNLETIHRRTNVSGVVPTSYERALVRSNGINSEHC